MKRNIINIDKNQNSKKEKNKENRDNREIIKFDI